MSLRTNVRCRGGLGLLVAPSVAFALLLVLVGFLRWSGTAWAFTVREYPGNAPCDSTLQACIDGSDAGDIIFISAATFITDEIVINKAITLTGAGLTRTILQAPALPGSRVISISGNLTAGVLIANLQIRGGRTDGFGGGIFSGFDTPLHLRNVAMVDNEAGGIGGALYAGGDLILFNGRIENNRATYGGGVATSGVATVTNSIFVSNSASSEGGALSSSGHTTITGSIFDSNRANYGGALWLGMLNGNSVDRSIFARNVVTSDGGAIFVHATTALTLTNSLVVSNSAGGAGGGIASGSSGLRLFNVTMVQNEAASGGGIMVLNGNLDLGNSILWGNRPDQIGQNVPLVVSGTNLIEGGAFGGLDANPRFVRDPNPAVNDLGDLHLSQASPAIDRGDNARLPGTLAQDLDGLPRFVDVVAIPNTGSITLPVDLGAYEVHNQLPVAESGGPYTGSEGVPIALDGSGSSSGDAGQAITGFFWDCTDDGSFDVTSDQPVGSTCIYFDQGVYTLRLRVVDAEGFTSEVTTTASVQNVTPTLTGQIDQIAQLGVPHAFTLGSFADPGADADWQVAIDWGDAQTSTFLLFSPGVIITTTHTYTASGDFRATVSVTDKDGATGSASFTVTVPSIVPPAGNITGRVVVDANGNGQADAGEAPLPDATVILSGPITSIQAAAVELTRITTTTAQGEYGFANVEAGRYELHIAKSGFVAIGPLEVVVQAGQLNQVAPVALVALNDEGENKLYLPDVQR